MKNYLKSDSAWKYVSAVSIIANTVLAIILLPSKKPLEFDYLGFIVGILTILVTVLIGFQIFNYFAVHDRLNKFETVMEEHKSYIFKTREKIQNEHYFCLASVSYVGIKTDLLKSMQNGFDVSLFEDAFLRYMDCIKNYLRAGDTSYFRLCMYDMSSLLDAFQSAGLVARRSLSDDFNEKCDENYRKMSPYFGILDSYALDSLHEIRERRKRLCVIPAPLV